MMLAKTIFNPKQIMARLVIIGRSKEALSPGEINNIAKAIKDARWEEVCVLPDKGVYLDVAVVFKGHKWKWRSRERSCLMIL